MHLVPELFRFKRDIGGDIEGQSHLEQNLLNPMPWIVTSDPSPLLVAAQVNTQAEFDRAFRSIVKEKYYRDKRMVFISCLNIDISPARGTDISPDQVCAMGSFHPGWQGESLHPGAGGTDGDG